MRGAWVEIPLTRLDKQALVSLPVRGAWVEISIQTNTFKGALTSLPVRGAWVEIEFSRNARLQSSRSLPVRGAWVEILGKIILATSSGSRSPCGERGLKWPDPNNYKQNTEKSLPVRGAWVEMIGLYSAFSVSAVAPRAGSVG